MIIQSYFVRSLARLFIRSRNSCVRSFEHFSFISLSLSLTSYHVLSFFPFCIHSYYIESCEKSCVICEDEYDTTEAPTGNLLDIVFDENVHDDQFQNEFHQGKDAVSTAPTQSPIAPFTDAPTESPSAYPTTPPTVNKFGDGGIFGGLDDDVLLATLKGI